MSGHCKDCKWWQLRQPSFPYKGDYGTPDYDKPINFRDCSNPDLVNIDSDGFKAMKPNGFGLNYPVCDLVTGPEFGCTKFDPKE